MECGKKFKTVAAAHRAVSNGCPKCGGTDIDIEMLPVAQTMAAGASATRTTP